MTRSALTHPTATPFPGAAWLGNQFWLVAAVLLVGRLFLAASCNLVPDEAFYWTWTRHLSTGYFDHPPMVAWVISLSTRLLGNTELGVRMPAAVMSIASLAVLCAIARRVLNDPRAVGFVILMWIAGPLLPVIGTIITPDAPATFFSVCALFCAVRIAEADDRAVSSDATEKGSARWWLLFGIFCGLALLSKYTTVLVPAGVLAAMLTSRQGRKHFVRPWICLAAILALAVFSPCIYWNYTHHWASFLFQIHHGSGSGANNALHGFLPRLLSLAAFIGGQAAVWTPVLLILLVVVIIVDLRRYQTLDHVGRVLVWSGTLPLIFFGVMSTRAHSEINWPAFAYFPLSILTARYLAEKWTGRRVHWARVGCIVAFGFTIGLHLLASSGVQQQLLRWRFPLTHQVTDLWGWPRFGQQLRQMAQGVPVVCNRHQDAGEAAFYMPGQPDIWCDSIGSRPTAFEYFDGPRPDFADVPEVLFVADTPQVNAFMAKWHYTRKIEVQNVVMFGLGKNRSRSATLLGR